ncbi:MAG: hypothetical protein COB23_03700 [Methylophaga sp.]|nr:MAG: hypothetical protein COB23_03700 [Methylophaga sp.]
MKHLVNVIQAIIIIMIAYPVFYIWDTNRVAQFCKSIEPGISTDQLASLVDEYSVTMMISTGSDGRWLSSIDALSPFTDYSCKIQGVANIIATAEIIEDE